jgi:hypothetical protein
VIVAQVGYSVAGLSRGQVALCAVCTVHVETRSASFLGEPQNQGQRFVSGLASKPPGRFLIGLGSKPMVTVCEWFGLKTTQTVFTSLASKLVVTVSGGLASKSTVTVSGSLASKPVVTVSSGLASKPAATVSPGLASKSVVGFLVEPQNQGGGGFSGLGLKTGSSSLVILASKLP